MKKKILFGSIFVLALILLMPSIPAIQNKTIEDISDNIIRDKIKNLIIKGLPEKVILGDIKYPVLNFIVVSMIFFRFFRLYWILWEINYRTTNEYVYFLSNVRAYWLEFTLVVMVEISEFLSDRLGWNWILPWTWDPWDYSSNPS